MTYEPVIGLEVHVQLNTATKIFCGCPSRFGAPPNGQVCPVCLGLPGVLPVLNRQALASGVKVALALGCRIQPTLKFDRKHYFYPDLPKNFQISQYDLPLAFDGVLEVPETADAPRVTVRIRRVHLEEDAGKLIHEQGERTSLVDYNRTGVPLLEIVSEPDLRTPEEAYRYLQVLKQTVEYLEVSDCDMEKGSLRCDANISLKAAGARTLGVKAEIKNLNSFKYVRAALTHEIARQQEVLRAGGRVTQETRLWDDAREATAPMRSKEYAHDYRYFPEPDLVPFSLAQDDVEAIRRTLPELPLQRACRFSTQYGLSAYDAGVLTSEKALADYFEACVRAFGEHQGVREGDRPSPSAEEDRREGTLGAVPGASASERRVRIGGAAKAVANWVQGDVLAQCRARTVAIPALGLPPAHLAQLLGLIERGTVTMRMAKDLLVQMIDTGEAPPSLLQRLGLAQVTDPQVLKAAAVAVIQAHAKAVSDYQRGKGQALKFLVGQLMARTKGQANPELAHEVLQAVLQEQLARQGGPNR